jgi:UDP-glucose 4-epimerase
VKAHGANALKREFEEVIRSELPDAVVHLGFIRHFHGDPRKRHDVNVRGTKRLLDLCVRYGVRKLVVVSSSTVYGAFPENPYHLDEDAPLSASRSYPEIRDLVEVDALASGFLWRHPEISSCVLRPVNVLGPEVQSMASRYLRQPRVPTVMGFDPMMQFIHQDDLIEAIVCALEPELRGVFNVIGSGEVPVHTAIAESGGTAWPIPEPLIRSAFSAFFRWGIGAYPVGMLDYLKYPVTLAGKRFAEETGYRALCGLRETFQSVRR